MAEGFNIEVPITIKSGREGEKIGTQIGEKIAAQLKKTFKSINIGGPKAGGDSAGVLGIAKGLKGVATKLGIVGVAIAATVGLLAKASPYLKGILSIFGRAFMIFFRPFGDFLAVLLRPMAILLMKMAVAFLRWFKSPTPSLEEPTGVAEVLTGGKSSVAGVLTGETGVIAKTVLPAIAEGIMGGFQEQKKRIESRTIIGTLFPNIISGGTSRERTSGGGSGVSEVSPVAAIIPKVVAGVLGGFQEQKERIQSLTLIGTIGKFLGSLFKGKGQVGISNVPSDGLYNLHKGEEVVPRTKVGQGKSVILNQNLNFSGPISSDIDIDSIARRASSITEMELKRRGII